MPIVRLASIVDAARAVHRQLLYVFDQREILRPQDDRARGRFHFIFDFSDQVETALQLGIHGPDSTRGKVASVAPAILLRL